MHLSQTVAARVETLIGIGTATGIVSAEVKMPAPVTLDEKSDVSVAVTLIANAAVGVTLAAAAAAAVPDGRTKIVIENAMRSNPAILCVGCQVRARRCDAESDVIVVMTDPRTQAELHLAVAVEMPTRPKDVFARHHQWAHHRPLHLLPHLLFQLMTILPVAGDLVEAETEETAPSIGIVSVSAVVTVDVNETTVRAAVDSASVDVLIPKTTVVKEVDEVHVWVEIASVLAAEERDVSHT
jgi:hypothetical protein